MYIKPDPIGLLEVFLIILFFLRSRGIFVKPMDTLPFRYLAKLAEKNVLVNQNSVLIHFYLICRIYLN